jgi:hypothetical protein
LRVTGIPIFYDKITGSGCPLRLRKRPIMLDNRSQQALQITPINFVSRIGLPIRTQGYDFLSGSIRKQFDGHAHMTGSRLSLQSVAKRFVAAAKTHHNSWKAGPQRTSRSGHLAESLHQHQIVVTDAEIGEHKVAIVG